LKSLGRIAGSKDKHVRFTQDIHLKKAALKGGKDVEIKRGG